MKRVLSVMLVLTLLLSAAISVSAYSLKGDIAAVSRKADRATLNRLSNMEDGEKADFIVHTAFRNAPTKADIDAKVAEQTQIDPLHFRSEEELLAYYQIRRVIRDDMKRGAVLENMERMGVTFDDVKTPAGELYTPDNVARKGLPYSYSLTRAQAEHLLGMDEVTDIGILYPTGELIMGPDEKMSESLVKRLVDMKDTDRVGVWAWQYDVSDDTIDALIREDFGNAVFGDAALYRRARLCELSDFSRSANQEIADCLGAAEEDRIFISSLTPSFILYLTSEQIWKLAYMNKVCSIGLYEIGFHVPEGAEKYCDTEAPLFERFMAWGNEKYGKAEYPVAGFEELYAMDGEWSIVHAPVGCPPPWEIKCGGVLGNRFIYSIGGLDISVSGYMLYDAKENDFISLTKIDLARYPGVAEALDELNLGLRLGDADTDGGITILDATGIQRALAGIDSLEGVSVEGGKSIFDHELLGDYDCDGKMTIMDAAGIQRRLAGLND